MNTEKIKFEITFTEPLLASKPGNREIMAEFLNNNGKMTVPAEELAAVPEPDPNAVENKSTVFPKDATGLLMWDYQIKGFLKENIYALIEMGEIKNLNKWNYRRAVDLFVRISPRRIYYRDPSGCVIQKPSGDLQRSMRVMTMQGERVALARSEALDPGTKFDCEATCFLATGAVKKTIAVIDCDLIRQCLDFAAGAGFGQWRSGGYGRFTWKQIQ